MFFGKNTKNVNAYWVFLFLWENRKLLKINKLDLDIIADYLPEKEDNPRFCF